MQTENLVAENFYSKTGEYNIHPNLVTQWKKKLLDGSADVFATKAEKKQQYDESYLLKKIGQLEAENGFLRKKLL
jgi:hypothetical protein